MNRKGMTCWAVALSIASVLTATVLTMLDSRAHDPLKRLDELPQFVFEGRGFVDEYTRQLCDEIDRSSSSDGRWRLYERFMDAAFSQPLERIKDLDDANFLVRNEATYRYGRALTAMEGVSETMRQHLICLRDVPPQKIWEPTFRYLETLRDEGLRRGRDVGYESRVRHYEDWFHRCCDRGAFSPDECAAIRSRFEQILGRPLRTLEEIDRVKRRLEAENIEASKCAHEASTRHSSVVAPVTSNP